MPPGPDVNVLHLEGHKLTPAQWSRLERFLEDWKKETIAAAVKHAPKSYELGMAQVQAFADLLANVSPTGAAGAFGGDSASLQNAAKWSKTYLAHELDGALSKYIDQIKSGLLYGIRSGENPTTVASRLYKATGDASVNWRMVARTEMVRANAAGRLQACADAGYDKVWCPPHVGSCPNCKRLLENKVFDLAEVLHATNYGKAEGEWVACIPLHPHCRHSWLPYDDDVYNASMDGYAELEAAGFTDEDRLDELFDESGQLRPGVDPSIFDTLKTAGNITAEISRLPAMDPFAEVLAAVIHKRNNPASLGHDESWLPTSEIRSDLYQRAVDWEKVERIFHGLRTDAIDPNNLKPIEVSLRPDGTIWVIDGQHRVEAYKMLGWPEIRAHVQHGLTWGEEAERCRALIAKCWSPAIDPDHVMGHAVVQDDPQCVAKSVFEQLVDELVTKATPPEPNEPDWEPATAPVDPAIFDGLRPRPEVLERLTSSWARAAGDDWKEWSWLYLPAYGGPARAQVDYPKLRKARPAWKKLADTDLHFALVAAALHATDGAELVPGRPLRIVIDPDQHEITPDAGSVWALGEQSWTGPLPVGEPADMAKTYPNYSWAPGAQPNFSAEKLGRVPRLLSEEEFLAKHTAATEGWHVAPVSAREAIQEHGLLEATPNTTWARYATTNEPTGVYVFLDRGRALKWAQDAGRLNQDEPAAAYEVWRVDLQGLGENVRRDPVLGEQGAVLVTLPRVEPSRLTRDVVEAIAKAAGEPTANAGVEHWITVHPNGPDEKGQPVLVRNQADGTMVVIGGAGGNLNMLRLDPSRRIDDEKKAKGAKVEQHLSAEEAEASSAQREEEVTSAREQLAKLTDARNTRQADLHAYMRDELGIDLDELDSKQRRKLLAKTRSSALRTLAYGEVSRRDVNDTPPASEFNRGEGQGTGRPLDGGSDSASSDEAPKSEPAAPRPSMAMSSEQAKTVLDAFLDISHLTKQGSQHRKVLAGEGSASDANQIDFTTGADDREQRRAGAVEQQVRTDLTRTLAEHADQKYRGKEQGYDKQYRAAAVQGGFDTLDAFSHTTLGRSALTLEAQKLLGVSGAAQLVANRIHEQTKGVGLDQIQDALKGLTDEQERAVNERGLARMQTALRRASQAQTELAASERGESLYTTTMARSIASEKVQEAKRGLGMMIGGLEACSALKVALTKPAGGKIKVGGWESPAKIKEAASKAGVKVHDSDIAKLGTGNYTLSLAPDRLQGLMREPPPVNQQLRDRLEQIRTGKDLDEEIEAQRTGPGMAHTLDANQAKGKMFLLAAGSTNLAYDPGVGKTHTALGAAETLMHGEPDKGHRALIIAPTNMLATWKDTIAAQGNGHTISVIDGNSAKRKQEQFTSGANYTIVSYESAKSPTIRKLIKDRKGGHSIVIADELQKAKNEGTDNYGAIEDAIDSARGTHGDDAHFWGLTGTPVEKSVNDVRSMKALSRRAKGQGTEDRKTAERKFGRLGQDEHIARGDKVRQFRQGLDEDLFRLTAQDAGNDLPTPDREHHQVELDPEHKADLQARVKSINAQMANYHQRKKEDPTLKVPVKFGGRDQLMDALYGREDSAITRKVADNIEKSGTFHHPGGMYEDGKDHAGEYEHKHVVFGASETSRALFGRNWNAPGAQRAKGGLHAELERRGIKVFTGHGSMSSADNEASYKAFLAHPSKAVFLTNDKNNAGISLQFGDNKGRFQHGATEMHHFTRPINNATIQQREARILRKGAQAPVKYRTYGADTPIEQRLDETLQRERRVQDLAANSEQQVAGADTLAHHLARRGVKPGRPVADAA